MTTQETLPFGYSDDELIEFKNNILSRLEKANTELEYLQSFIVSPDDENRMFLPDKKDDDTGFEKEQISQMIVRQQTFINNLNQALIRIENKTYGICRVTGKLIDKARLFAVPHATLSLEAKLGLDKKTQEAAASHVPAKPKNKKGKKENQAEKIPTRYPDNDLREFKTIISNKMEAANEELKYFSKVLEWRNKNIKVEDYEDMKPAEVEALIERQQSFINELQSALDRVKNKTYGIDEDSGELMPKEVLIRNVIIRRSKPTPDHPSVVTEHTADKIRTCRICGCTDNDCKQCIEKTGHPCQWIAEDLCSACEEEAMKRSEMPAELKAYVINQIVPGSASVENKHLVLTQDSAKIELSEAEKKHLEELENTPTNNDNDMNFFQQLAQAGAQNVDLTMRIMQKDGKLTLNIMPGAKSVTIKPILVTGTPQELDAEFFKTIAPGLNEITGIVTNLEEVKKDLDKKSESAKPKPENVKPGAKEATASAAKNKSPKTKSSNKKEPEIKPEVNNETVQQPEQENAEGETEGETEGENTNEAAE